MAETCRDGQRKERKKGVKRGPYKRKIKTQNEEIGEISFHDQTPEDLNLPPPCVAFHQADGEWVSNQSPQGNPAAPTTIHTFSAHPPPPHEGPYYPYYLPPHPFQGFVPPPQGQEGSGDGNGSQGGGTGSFVVQYYVPHPPGGFPPLPYGHYPFPGIPPQVVHQQQQQQSQAQQQAPQQPQTANNTEGGAAASVQPIEEEKKLVDEPEKRKGAEKKKGKKSKVPKTGEGPIAVDS
jgi:hypothetical protein